MNDNDDSQKIKCLVVDDEPLAAALISSYVNNTPFLSLAGEAHSAEEALDRVGRGDIQLVFLDIRMPRLDGVQLARILPKDTLVVFTTAYSDHAVEGFRVNALDYLLKPVSYDEFIEAAMRARDRLLPETRTVQQPQPVQKKTHLLVKSEYKLLRLEISRILYIEGLKDYVKIVMADEKEPVLSLMSIKRLEEELPDNFMRIHRSFIVNIDKVRVVEKNCVNIRGQAIPISESYRSSFLQRLQE